MKEISQLENRLLKLEEKFEHQDQTIETLNDVIVSQQAEIARLHEELIRIKEMGTSDQSAEGVRNERPPHY